MCFEKSLSQLCSMIHSTSKYFKMWNIKRNIKSIGYKIGMVCDAYLKVNLCNVHKSIVQVTQALYCHQCFAYDRGSTWWQYSYWSNSVLHKFYKPSLSFLLCFLYHLYFYIQGLFYPLASLHCFFMHACLNQVLLFTSM